MRWVRAILAGVALQIPRATSREFFIHKMQWEGRTALKIILGSNEEITETTRDVKNILKHAIFIKVNIVVKNRPHCDLVRDLLMRLN